MGASMGMVGASDGGSVGVGGGVMDGSVAGLVVGREAVTMGLYQSGYSEAS